MPKQLVECSWCSKSIYRNPSELKLTKNSYCSSDCRSKHLSKKHNPEGYLKRPHLSQYNIENNKDRMTPEVRKKLRMAKLDKGVKDSYRKLYGVHEHRLVAEIMLGRKLKKGEVVHHIDLDKRNNSPENLMVFANQADHAKWHVENRG